MAEARKGMQRIRIAGAIRRDSLLRDIWRGAWRQLARVPGCQLASFNVDTDMQELLDWRPDGVIAHVWRKDIYELLADLDVPIVNTSGIFGDLPVPTVSPDNRAVGQLAAEHLLAKGYAQFAFVGLLRQGFARQRLEGFRQTLGGREVAVFDGQVPPARYLASGEVGPTEHPFHQWIEALPPATGLLAADDTFASGVVEFCNAMGFRPTEQLGVISGHDRQAPCNPSLTAITMPEQRWGEEAARLVVRMVRANLQQAEDVALPPLGIVERESTAGVAAQDPHLREAVAFIRDHADQLISVEDVCRATALGRRALERRFRRHLGHTMLQEIHRVHVEQAKTLLAETDWPVKHIAPEAGFSDQNQMLRLFKKRVGTTPGAFRRRLRLSATAE